MALVDTSTSQQRHTVSHQGIEFDDMVVDVAFTLSYRKLVVEGHFHREFEKSLRSKHIRRNWIKSSGLNRSSMILEETESKGTVATVEVATLFVKLYIVQENGFQSHCHRFKHGVLNIKWSITGQMAKLYKVQ